MVLGCKRGGEGFEEWEFGRPALVETGLGYEYPENFEAYLAATGVSEPEFRAALMHTTEVLYRSLWGAADNAGSLGDVKSLAGIALAAGAKPCRNVSCCFPTASRSLFIASSEGGV